MNRRDRITTVKPDRGFLKCDIEGLEELVKPGPKPKHGETMPKRQFRSTQEAWDWIKGLGGAGDVIENIYRSQKREAFEKWYKKEIRGQD